MKRIYGLKESPEDKRDFYMPENYVTAGYAGEFWTIDA